VVTELQDYILMGITRRCQQKISGYSGLPVWRVNPPEPATFWSPVMVPLDPKVRKYWELSVVLAVAVANAINSHKEFL
jgi:hypothetical protein